MSKFKNIFIAILCVILISLSCYIFLYFHNIRVGREAVINLYTFNNYQSLEEYNMPTFRELTTKEVYDEFTYDNFGNAVNFYLKFCNKPTGVNIISSKHGCVKFNYINEYVSSGAEYEFVYTTNIFGRINSAKLIPLNATVSANN